MYRQIFISNSVLPSTFSLPKGLFRIGLPDKRSRKMKVAQIKLQPPRIRDTMNGKHKIIKVIKERWLRWFGYLK